MQKRSTGMVMRIIFVYLAKRFDNKNLIKYLLTLANLGVIIILVERNVSLKTDKEGRKYVKRDTTYPFAGAA